VIVRGLMTARALLLLAACVLPLAGCGGTTKTTTVTSTRTVVRTATVVPPATTTTPPTTSTGTTPSVPSGPRSCGRIDITYPNGEGGSSAVNITAFGLGCTEARAVTRACQRGNLTPGWTGRLRGSSRVEMTARSGRITFGLAGGGGCLAG
jgi:hypothetical protein